MKIAKVAGDDDNTGMSQVRRDGNIDIIKESDKNHVRKNISKKLYSLVPKFKSLTKKMISSVTKNFNYMLQQNRGKPEQIAIGLKAVVEHMFGNHTYCGTWCGYLADPEKYKHGNLPYGKDLTDETLCSALSEIFSGLNVNKLAFLSSTQANESFNNTVASKAPKCRHYSGSSSLQYWLCASVSQKNEGYGYMTGVHKVAGLSPSVSAIKRGYQQDKICKCKRAVQRSITFKRKCLQLKSEWNSKETATETREGDTYATNIGMEKDVPDLSEISIAAAAPIFLPADVSYVMFDLETGGFSRT